MRKSLTYIVPAALALAVALTAALTSPERAATPMPSFEYTGLSEGWEGLSVRDGGSSFTLATDKSDMEVPKTAAPAAVPVMPPKCIATAAFIKIIEKIKASLLAIGPDEQGIGSMLFVFKDGSMLAAQVSKDGALTCIVAKFLGAQWNTEALDGLSKKMSPSSGHGGRSKPYSRENDWF